MLEKLIELNDYLLTEMPEYRESSERFPVTEYGQFDLFRALSNVRMPGKLPERYQKIQDEILSQKIADEGIVDINKLEPVKIDNRLYLWQGDITRLNADAIVNAANSQMLGCFVPLHNCIDNIIHTKAGIQLRAVCNEMMKSQGYDEPVGEAKITDSFNLPSKYIIHTVGPRIEGDGLRQEDIELLKSSYHNILKLADQEGLESVAFCCISTGVFRFPNDIAAEIAVNTVEKYLNDHPETSLKKIIFNVFKDEDKAIYDGLLNSIS